MRLLVDTDLFIEVLLDQARAIEARNVLANPKGHSLFASDFSVHSIGLLLFRWKQRQVFRQFMQDLIAGVGIEMLSLTAPDMENLIEPEVGPNLDFDDTYQLVVAVKYGLKIVSFDSDFDRTPEGRLLPADVL